MYLTYKGLHCNVCGVTAAVRVFGGRRTGYTTAVAQYVWRPPYNKL